MKANSGWSGAMISPCNRSICVEIEWKDNVILMFNLYPVFALHLFLSQELTMATEFESTQAKGPTIQERIYAKLLMPLFNVSSNDWVGPVATATYCGGSFAFAAATEGLADRVQTVQILQYKWLYLGLDK